MTKLEVVPKRFFCQLCGARCPTQYMRNGHEAALKRRSWMRRHRTRKHPEQQGMMLDQALKQSEAEKENE